MSKRTKEGVALESALRSNDIIAEVIKFSAIWEASLDSYLAVEFGGTTARYDDFIELVAPNLSFARKIEMEKVTDLFLQRENRFVSFPGCGLAA